MSGHLQPELDAIRHAWHVATHELGVRVTTADCALIEPDGTRHPLVAVVRDFGGKSGMAILPEYDPAVAELAQSQGYGFTVLGAGYDAFSRELFEETLNDWQWCGAGDPPSWYTGEVVD